MMRHKTGIVCVVAALAVAACSFGGQQGSSGPTPDASGTQAVCGDNVCAATEVNSCAQDCGSGGNNMQAVCGNGQCETTKGESATSCPSDCGGGGGGSGSGGGGGGGSGALNCSDPTVLLACFTCIGGGGCTGVDPTSCQACLGGGSGLGSGTGTGCTGGVPDGVCDSMESNATCPFDCP